MGNTIKRAVIRLAGFIRLKGGKLDFEFPAPVGAGSAAQQAAFVAALGKVADVDYVCTRRGVTRTTFIGHVEHNSARVQVAFDAPNSASTDDIDAAFYAALKAAVTTMDYCYAEEASA
jgi:hypothetical protein